ncbi:MAG: restriction endonuclease [Bacteroidales bacterium]|nr:restriction endonuclease [Bacteroidales bacterium]
MNFLQSTAPFKSAATLLFDYESLFFTERESFLRHKAHPALKAEDIVKESRKKAKEYFIKYKTLEFQISYIKTNFPELGEYLESERELIERVEHSSYQTLIDEHYDARKEYLSQSEYDSLSDSEKSQIALDRYIRGRNKSNWFIGRDFEMSCAFQLMAQGWKVEMFGVRYRLGDLGRDLIAVNSNYSLFGVRVMIVQCKYWSGKTPIRENVIMQLAGTTLEYKFRSSTEYDSVCGCLIIGPNTEVTEMALHFASVLNIEIRRLTMVEFPRIKCNINNGEKIYHLPFDQMYDKTVIKNKGEMFVWTVAEAEKHGFRHAKRYDYLAKQ